MSKNQLRCPNNFSCNDLCNDLFTKMSKMTVLTAIDKMPKITFWYISGILYMNISISLFSYDKHIKKAFQTWKYTNSCYHILNGFSKITLKKFFHKRRKLDQQPLILICHQFYWNFSLNRNERWFGIILASMNIFKN